MKGIFIMAESYWEKDENGSIVINKPGIIENQVYSNDLYARKIHKDGRPYHTFRTSTVLVDGNDIKFRNCQFRNTAGSGKNMGQAIALYLDGDGIELCDCEISGLQDTLFLAPLPEKEREKDGFLGPKQFSERKNRKFVFRHCLIKGSVDFVFGGAEAWFYDCEFMSLESGYVFAPSTPEGMKGFTAIDCRFTSAPGVAPASCFLGRPWRNFGQVTLKNCEIGENISLAGWSKWPGMDDTSTVRFTEIGSYGPLEDQFSRPSWVRFESR